MNTLTELKSKLQVGVTLTLLRVRGDVPDKRIGVQRKIVKRQSNAIVLSGFGSQQDSWLFFDKAGNYKYKENGFEVYEDGVFILEYRIGETG